jgi:hypothetical protein
VSSPVEDPWLPARLDALLHVAEVESRMLRAVRTALTAWLREARAQVLGSGLQASGESPPDPDGLVRATPALDAALAAYFQPALERAFGDAFRRALRDADIADQPYRERFVAEAISRVRTIEPLTYERIRETVAEGLARGYSMQTIAEGVRQALTLDGKSPLWTMFRAHSGATAERLAAEMADLRATPYADRGPDWQARLEAVMAGRESARKDAAVGRSRQVREPGVFSMERALAIARTETMAALNGGTTAAMSARAAITGLRVEKVWLATDDRRTRRSHAAMDGQRVPVDGKFTVGGAQMSFPGDPAAPARQTVNCRCTVLEYVEGEAPLALDPASGRRMAGRLDAQPWGSTLSPE